MKLILKIFFAVILIFFVLLFSFKVSAVGDWPMLRYDEKNSGYSPWRSEISTEKIELSYLYENETFLSPIVFDLDKDGKNEIILTSREGNLYVIKNFNELYSTYRANEKIRTSATVADLEDDSTAEIFFSAGRVLYALNAEGEILFNFVANSEITSAAKIYDLNNDGRKEIIFGCGDGTLYVLDSKGNEISKFKAQGSIESYPAIADINNDGRQDIIFGSRDNRLYVITPAINGRPLNIVGIYLAKGDIVSSPSVYDVDNDGKEEIVFGSADGNIYCLGYWEIINENRKFINIGNGNWKTEVKKQIIFKDKWSYKTNREILSSTAISDIDGDSLAEIVFGSSDKNLYVLNGFGKKIYSYTVNDKIIASPVVADLNNDGKKEIIFASADGKIYILKPEGFKIFEYKTSGKITESPIIADIDNDNKAEIMVASENKKFYIFSERKEYKPMMVPELTTMTTVYEFEEDLSSIKEVNKNELKNETENMKANSNSITISAIVREARQGFTILGIFLMIITFGMIAVYISYKAGVSSTKSKEKITKNFAEEEELIEIVLRERLQRKEK
ncbi:MAG: PQQ-binding-like beta-propeller repeat protein [Candidatus Altiarchaeota archaeon]